MNEEKYKAYRRGLTFIQNHDRLLKIENTREGVVSANVRDKSTC